MLSAMILRVFFIFAIVLLGIAMYRWSGDLGERLTIPAAVTSTTLQQRVVSQISTTTTLQNVPSDALLAEQEQLEEMQENLELLRNQRTEQNQQLQQGSLTIPSQISSIGAQIQNLTELLQTQRLAEADLQQAAQNQLEMNVVATQASRDQMDENIRQLTSQIQNTQNELSRVGFGMTDAEREAATLPLQGQLSGLQDQLNNLYTQRANLNAQLYEQMQGVNWSLQSERGSLVQEQESIQSEIFSLRDQAREIQRNQTQTRMSLMTLDQQIRQAEQAIQSQRQRIQEMQTTLR